MSSSNFNPALYSNKIIMAPMVKIGTLPGRLLALRFGADLVYTEEIIDWKLLKSKRVVNDALGTIDFVDEAEGVTAFRTCAEEKSKVICQIGTSDPDRALKVAQLVQNDVAGVDINMGCPKEFSVKGGMGAALLRQPEKIKAILTNLVTNLSVPVTCKIRVLSSIEQTVQLCEMIQSCGVSAIAIHGRTKDERQQHANRDDFIKTAAEKLTIPVIANGGSRDIEKYEDINIFKGKTGCHSVMLARAAEWNPSIFRKEGGKEDIQQVITKYLKLAVQYDNPFPNSKYNIQNMLRELQDTPLGKKFLASNVMEELCEIWDIVEFYQETRTRLRSFINKSKENECDNSNGVLSLSSDNVNDGQLSKKPKLELTSSANNINGNGVSNSKDQPIVVPECVFIRGNYPDVDKLPKSILLVWYKKNGLGRSPKYITDASDKKFRSSVEIGEQIFRTDVWEKNKKHAEQGAALAFIKYMKLSS